MDITSSREDRPRTPLDRPPQRLFSDNPADHGLSEAEIGCIEKAYEIRRREVRASLDKPPPFQLGWGPLGVEWPKTGREQLKWVLLVPFIAVFLGILQGVAAPFQYAAYRREMARRSARLRQELAALGRRPLLQPLPGRTLRDLWSVYGLERNRFPEAVCLELASAWIDRLYGPETARTVNLTERMNRVDDRRAKQRALATRVTCVCWIPRLEQVLRELSTELPPYGQARDS